MPGRFRLPIGNLKVTGNLKPAAWGECTCQNAIDQIKLKVRATNTLSKAQTLRLGGTTTRPTGPYLIALVPKSYKTPVALPEKSLRTLTYPTGDRYAPSANRKVLLIPANPDGYAIPVSGSSYTWATHWNLTTIKAQGSYTVAGRRAADIVFDVPSNVPAWAGIVWLTDSGVLYGDFHLFDDKYYNGDLGSF